jgi:hypothetical protein
MTIRNILVWVLWLALYLSLIKYTGYYLTQSQRNLGIWTRYADCLIAYLSTGVMLFFLGGSILLPYSKRNLRRVGYKLSASFFLLVICVLTLLSLLFGIYLRGGV